MELRSWGGPSRWTIVANTLSERRKTKRRDSTTERHVVSAELFREETALVVILVNSPTTRK